ncbi:MAG: LLM class flavin-dependent oxidoreductase [Deltaproteobacteria bacterium]|nr:LLM class flavin-dependent oxidoreductase [Deltaproteobacteria bacterium]
MEFYYFHLMPWPHLPDDFDRQHPSSWVTFSNRHYDPQRGHDLYNEYLDEMELAEKLGFDGLGVNEHHQNAYGTMPSPNLMAAALVRRTSRAKIAILGNAIPLRDHPLRVAEEVAMLDVMSGGRIISGFVRGIGCEYISLGINPTYSRERFYEAHDLILRAWTEPGPFSFEGRHYQVRYANIWPRPLQQPHPPIWLPSQGSTETIRWGAQRRYPFVSVFTSYAQTKRLIEEYKDAAEAAGYQAPAQQIGFAVPTYVAETDAQARAEAKPHMLWLYRRGLKIPPNFLLPPGYITEDSLRKFLAAGLRTPSDLSFEELEAGGYVLVGSTKTVVDRLKEIEKDLGLGLFIGGGRIGDMPKDKALKNMELFAREVIPHFRDPAPTANKQGSGAVKRKRVD